MRSPTIRLDRRIYADQDGGGHAYVIDGASMKVIGKIVMPADDLESPSIDPKTGTLYQNLANDGGFAIVDPATLHVFKVVDTPQLTDNHAPVFAPEADQVWLPERTASSRRTPRTVSSSKYPNSAEYRSVQHRREGSDRGVRGQRDR